MSLHTNGTRNASTLIEKCAEGAEGSWSFTFLTKSKTNMCPMCRKMERRLRKLQTLLLPLSRTTTSLWGPLAPSMAKPWKNWAKCLHKPNLLTEESSLAIWQGLIELLSKFSCGRSLTQCNKFWKLILLALLETEFFVVAQHSVREHCVFPKVFDSLQNYAIASKSNMLELLFQVFLMKSWCLFASPLDLYEVYKAGTLLCYLLEKRLEQPGLLQK